MAAYYNENCEFAAQWLRNLILAGHLPRGDVDERSITEVRADDVRGYVQQHYFAGIGGWPLALRLAGWPEDREAWSGSCPCQPLSCAGKRQGHLDERHLWPAFYALISQCKPATIFGEQSASKLGREWMSGVRIDLEEAGYAVGAANLPACAFGAPHERQRLWFVADRISPTAGRRDTNGWRVCGLQEMEPPSSDTGSGQQWKATTGRKPCHREMGHPVSLSEWFLTPCDFTKTWQSWNGGFSGFGRLDDGVSPRVAKSVVGGFGNAIVPQVAQAFIEAFMECIP